MTEIDPQLEPHAAPPTLSRASSSTAMSWSSLSQKKRALILCGGGVLLLLGYAVLVLASSWSDERSGVQSGDEVEAQVARVGDPLEQIVATSIRDFRVWKTHDTLRLRFEYDPVKGQMCGVCRFAITMSDADGNRIDSFTTNRVHDLWSDWREPSTQHVELVYQINPGIARRTHYVAMRVIYH